ncbi:hypothetical protein [Synechococcus sp. R5-12]
MASPQYTTPTPPLLARRGFSRSPLEGSSPRGTPFEIDPDHTRC